MLAADFWTTDFHTWTDKDVLKMLGESPWASEFSQRLPGMGPGSSAGRGGSPGGPVQSGGTMQDGGPPPMEKFTITWRTATPIKQALSRAMAGPDPISPQLQAYIDKEEDHYLITVSGLKRYFGQVSTDPEELMQFAVLEIKGRGVIKPQRAESRSDQSSTTIFYEFSKSTPITLDDKEVDFVFHMERTPLARPGRPGPTEGPTATPAGGDLSEGNAPRRAGVLPPLGARPGGGPKLKALDIRRKFRLKELVYNGKLDL